MEELDLHWPGNKPERNSKWPIAGYKPPRGDRHPAPPSVLSPLMRQRTASEFDRLTAQPSRAAGSSPLSWGEGREGRTALPLVQKEGGV